MSLAQSLSCYLALNLLIGVAYLSLKVFSLLVERPSVRTKSKFELELHYIILVAVVALTCFHPFFPKSEFFAPTAKVWSAQSLKSFNQDYMSPNKGGYLSLPMVTGLSSLEADKVSLAGSAIAFVVFIFGAVFIGRDLRTLVRIKRRSYLVRKFKNVGIYISDQIHVPFSYWLPGQVNVVMPTHFVSQRGPYAMALSHEFQHHRHGDTKWVYLLWGLRFICVFNPFIHLWNKWLSEIQEFACDEALVDQNKVESQAYARCLVEVAQTAVNQKYVPVCATGLMFLSNRKILKRRIEKMFTQTLYRGRSISLSFAVGLTCLMAVTVFASKSFIQDRRVTMDEARAMAKNVGTSDFPVVVNELVLKQLNRYIGTSDGREFMRDSLQRMKAYKSMIESNLAEYGAPMELAAIPLIESGYKNLESSKNPVGAAGLWQFIASTARTFDLRVDSDVDERMNEELATDAASRYLVMNNLRFKDWHLSALAYNMGEKAVREAMDKTKSRNAWVLIRKGHENDKDYLPKLMAAVLIMKNPTSVE